MLHTVVFHELLVSCLFDDTLVHGLLLLEAVGLFHLFHLLEVVLSHDVVSGCLSHLGVLDSQLLLFHFSLHSQLVLAVAVFLISVSDDSDLVSFALGLLDLLPGFLFFKFQEGDSVRE